MANAASRLGSICAGRRLVSAYTAGTASDCHAHRERYGGSRTSRGRYISADSPSGSHCRRSIRRMRAAGPLQTAGRGQRSLAAPFRRRTSMLTIDTSEVCNPPRGIVGYSVLCAAWRLFIISKPLRRSRLRQRCRLSLALCLFGGRLGGSLAIQLVDPFARHPLDEEIGEGPHQRVDPVRRKAGRLAIKVGREASGSDH